MRYLVIVPIVLAIFWSIASIFFAGLSVITYTRLSDEDPIAKVYFKKGKPLVYKAYLTEIDTNDPVEYQIFGDQWRIDAQFIKMKPWANILGLDARHNLERFQGRYKNIKDENTRPHQAYDLKENDLIEIPQFVLDYNFFIDVEYGSSTYNTINTSKLYTVYRTQSGIIVRQQPLAKKPEKEEGLIEEIKKFFSGR